VVGEISRESTVSAKRPTPQHKRIHAELGEDPAVGRQDLYQWLEAEIAKRNPEAERPIVFVADGEPLLRIVDLERLYVEAQVSEYDLAKVEASPGASFRLSAYPDRLIPILGSGGGRLANIGATVDPLSRTVAVRYEVPNAEGLLRVGMYADVLIETARRADVLAVPSEAVLDDNGAPVVFVQTGGESFERRLVAIGLSDGEMTEIREGLKAGERVVVRGAYSIRLSMLSGAIPEHHHH
jgi:RND family efflux transporter MFP subunit